MLPVKNSNNHKTNVIRTSMFLGVLGFISLNIYLPAIQSIAKDFQVKPSELKFSITLFLIGFSLSQFYWGSLSAKYGRKKAIFHGLMLANIGTLLALFAPSLFIFNCARLIEGTGIGCASVLCRALLTDVLTKEKLSKSLSIIVSLANVMPALAPLIGGYLVLFFSWRAIFALLLIYTLTLTILIERNVGETNTNIKQDLTIKHALSEYKQVLSSRTFIGYLIPYLALSSGMIGYYAATPFIFITQLHIAPQNYSYLSVFTVAAYIVGVNLSGSIRKHIDFNGTILLGTMVALSAAIILFVLNYFSHLSVMTVIFPMMLYLLGCGLVSPNANACALNELRHIAGASSAVIGSSIYATSAITTIFLTSLDLSKLSSLAIYTLIISVIAVLSFYILIATKKT
jgi:Bcr/CflA subfamily drug resistance transporter